MRKERSFLEEFYKECTAHTVCWSAPRIQTRFLFFFSAMQEEACQILPPNRFCIPETYALYTFCFGWAAGCQHLLHIPQHNLPPPLFLFPCQTRCVAIPLF